MHGTMNSRRRSIWARLALLAAVTLAGVLLTWIVVAAQNGPDFTVSKTAASYTREGALLTYRIDVTNDGGAQSSVVLSDTLPQRVLYQPDSCAYWYAWEDEADAKPCGSPPQLWTLPFGVGTTVHTRLVVKVDTGTMMWPLTNVATVIVDGEQFSDTVTTIANLPFAVYMPMTARNLGP